MVMEMRQESSIFESVRILSEGRAEAIVTEDWWYRHWQPTTGITKQAPRRVRYKNKYTLIKTDNRWLIDKLKEMDYKELWRAPPSQAEKDKEASHKNPHH